jgi:AraC-like DNA-binding protein
MPVSEYSTIKNIMNFIDLNLGENLEVERLAKVTHFSVDYFSKMFKKVTGESPAKHVSKRRIIKSKELLCEDVVQIDEIAYRLGFCDSSHFIKAFKKAEGLTPAEFRRQSMLYKL